VPGTAEQETLHVGGRALERRLVDVDDREVRLREALRRSGDRVTLGEADADDQVVALPRERRHVRDVVGRGVRLDDPPLDPELPLGPLEAVVRELVEAVVVQLAGVRDEAHFQLLRGRRLGRRRRRRAGRLAVAATPCRERRHDGDERQSGPTRCASCHGATLLLLVFDYES
jgi:hypothetical protein